jgi:hypothetical protein
VDKRVRWEDGEHFWEQMRRVSSLYKTQVNFYIEMLCICIEMLRICIEMLRICIEMLRICAHLNTFFIYHNNMLGFAANTTIFNTEYKSVPENENKSKSEETVHHIKIYHRPVISCVNAQFYSRLRVSTWCEAIRNYDYTYCDPEWVNASDLTTDHFVCVPISKKEVPLTNDLLTHGATQIPEDIQDAPIDVVDEFLTYLDVKRYSDNRFIVLGLERLYLKRGLKDVVYPPNFFIDGDGWFKVVNVTKGEGVCSDCKEAELVENVLVHSSMSLL